MIQIKTGVTPKNLVILAAAGNAAHELGIDIVVTAGTDGKHMEHSKHYVGEALDIRLMPGHQVEFNQRLKDRLGPDYQVILEQDHLHVEYDPAITPEKHRAQ